MHIRIFLALSPFLLDKCLIAGADYKADVLKFGL
tara:strand:+ start:1059 stop:1160 length:102 start_codon:yes stop_codon:yes gene_type:complete